MRRLELRAAQSAAYLSQMSDFLSKPPEARATLPLPSAHMPEKTPPEPRADQYLLIARIRQGLCFGAFAVAAALPFLWTMSPREFARRHRRMIAEAMLGLALFGSVGMMLGWGHLANWKQFRIGTNAAGYGLVLVPLGVVAVVLASRGGDGADDDAGGSKM